MSVLLLGGTAEARALADVLVGQGIDVVSSLAGALASVRLPPGQVRVGGFGGADGLADYLRERLIESVIDATHPFAARISAHAALACAATSTPLLRLERPSWAERPDASGWCWVDDLAAARTAAGERGRRIFLAVGRQGLAELADWTDRTIVARVVEPPAVALPTNWQLVAARGPFSVAEERALFAGHRVEVLVAKDSGGPTTAKLDAAAELGVAVVMVRRPPAPDGVAAVASVAEAQQWLAQTRRSR
ncbi:precorrin-6A reductase [Propionicimonas paludicola]|uniref:Precorrin-6A reductase n=1 Tax=Propionicimonas paludicola TaxID=185243 RepID=A0A2A9CV26_9ACTN|nr:cobalt-precorrin-6A reductase [Propionicimonas paludicola]PFG17895.1 precorrin-6A reductase [Propionicimonas paludicola]